MAARVFLDSCVIIYMGEGPKEQRRRLTSKLAAEAGEVITTELVRLECLVGPLRGNNDDLLAHYEAFFSDPLVRPIPISASIFAEATRLRAGLRLGTADALHVATALHAGCDAFWTNDDKLAAVSDRLRVVVAR